MYCLKKYKGIFYFYIVFFFLHNFIFPPKTRSNAKPNLRSFCLLKVEAVLFVHSKATLN